MVRTERHGVVFLGPLALAERDLARVLRVFGSLGLNFELDLRLRELHFLVLVVGCGFCAFTESALRVFVCLLAYLEVE